MDQIGVNGEISKANAEREKERKTSGTKKRISTAARIYHLSRSTSQKFPLVREKAPKLKNK